MKRRTWMFGWALICAVSAATAHAEVTAADMQVAARALSFLENPLTGTVRLGIVHAPASPRSKQEAEKVAALLRDGMRIGGLELQPVLIDLADARDAQVDLFYLTGAIGPRDASVVAITAARQMPCVTTHVGLVAAGKCALGVRSSPKVEILVHREAARASGMTFATVFRVMVKEL